MKENYFAPNFYIRINGSPIYEELSKNITSFVFTDHEKQLDSLDLTLINSNLQLFDNSDISEGNKIEVKFGYNNDLSPLRTMVIKEIEYRANSNGLTTTLTALNLGFNLAGKVRQILWVNEDKGYITYSEIACKIANEYGLTFVVEETSSQHFRISQSTSDSQFLSELALKAVSKDRQSGYVFFIEDQELHFHLRNLEQKPFITLYYKPIMTTKLD